MWSLCAPTGTVNSSNSKCARRLFAGLFAFLLVSSGSLNAIAASVTVNVDTTSLLGMGSQLAFDLIDGDGINNNSVIISAFSSDGSLGSSTSSGGVTGSLPASVVIDDTLFFNEVLQGIVLGSNLTFTLEFTNNFAGGAIPDGFSFVLLDATGTNSLVASDLLGDAMLVGDYSGFGAFSVTRATTTNPSVPVSLTITPDIPEPSSYLLFLISGALALVLRRTGPGRHVIRWLAERSTPVFGFSRMPHDAAARNGT